jgi:hypothetical protein
MPIALVYIARDCPRISINLILSEANCSVDRNRFTFQGEPDNLSSSHMRALASLCTIRVNIEARGLIRGQPRVKVRF